MRTSLVKSILSIVPQAISHKLVDEFVPIFMMHRIIDNNGDPDLAKVKHLQACLEYIRKHAYQPIALDDMCKLFASCEPLPRKSVVFTVDDGFADQFEQLAPIFSQYDVPLTCFLITDMLDGILWPWDDQVKYIISATKLSSFLAKLPNDEQFLCNFDGEGAEVVIEKLRFRLKNQDQTQLYDWLQNLYNVAEVDVPNQPPLQYKSASWEQANEFVDNGHSVAAHTKTHRILSRLNDTEVREEILGSYEYLKKRIPGSSDMFAYPTGRSTDFGVREENIIKDSPIICAVSTIHDAVRMGCELTALPRYTFPNNVGDFLQCLSFIEILKKKVRNI